VHNATDNAQMDQAAQTISRTTQNTAHTAMDYALKTQEMNTRLLQQTSQAWIDGFRYQAKLSQALARMTPVGLPVERQSGSEVTEEPATNGVQKVSEEPAAKDAQKDIEIAEKAEKAEKQQAEKKAREQKKAEKKAETQQAESAQKSAEPAAEETQKSTEIAAFPSACYDEMSVGEVSERLLRRDERRRSLRAP
jgi:hypothetical protein